MIVFLLTAILLVLLFPNAMRSIVDFALQVFGILIILMLAFAVLFAIFG